MSLEDVSTIIFTILLVLFVLSYFTLLIILFAKTPKKYSETPFEDIIIPCFSSLTFTNNTSTPNYTDPNLGSTGRVILDCYTGKCEYEYASSTDSKGFITYSYEYYINYFCSEQCSYNGKNECNCKSPYNSKGTCSRKYDDNYIEGKYCYADNIIYYWKGKRYEPINDKIFTYYANAFLKDEECPKGTKYCGIIDYNENKLCISTRYNCPINYISENKLNENISYQYVIIGNKTIYYTYDNNTIKNRKIIAGLVADTDLYLNKDNDKKEIIDTYTISGFLEDNKNLYKKVNLGFDPYKEKNIDSKGKSYLRIYYNEGIDLAKLRINYERYVSNLSRNKHKINPIKKYIKCTAAFGFIALFILVLNFACFFGKEKQLIPITIVFGIFMSLSLFFACLNISKLNELKKLGNRNNFKISRIVNLIIVISGFSFMGYLVLYLILIGFLIDKCDEWKLSCCCNKKNKSNEISNNTVTNSKTDFK